MHVAATLSSQLRPRHRGRTAHCGVRVGRRPRRARRTTRTRSCTDQRRPLAAVAVTTLAVATVMAVGLAVALRPLRRVVVEGESMRPALSPGDRLLVVRLRRGAPLVPGAVVAANDPRNPRRLVVKRVAAVDDDGRVVLHGDNTGASTDSRAYGPVARGSVWGIARYRYAPPARAGRLR